MESIAEQVLPNKFTLFYAARNKEWANNDEEESM
jgi:hypothetical protein